MKGTRTVKQSGPKVFFAMAVHCHQPVYNFGWEIEKAYENAYLPLLQELEKNDQIKMTIHFTGTLLKWLDKERPEYIEKLKALYERGQVEFLGGACYDPILPMIPKADRVGQIKMNKDVLSSIMGVRAQGVWLAERLWEPDLLDLLVEEGACYTIMDDQHLLDAGVKKEEINRPFKISSEKNTMVVFPALTRLRYSIPFRRVKYTLNDMRSHLKSKKKDIFFFFADDGEKFGAWPGTYKHVYGRKWLENFFNALSSSSSWLSSCTYGELFSRAEGEAINIPASSYPEMLKWSEGDFRNFSKKYTESGRMIKRMYSVSGKISAKRANGISPGIDPEKLAQALEDLYKAQSGCAYWHGVFAGIYQPHFRKEVYRYLLEAEENITDHGLDTEESGCLKVEKNDLEGEISVRTDNVRSFLSREGASVAELDFMPLRLNVSNVLTRRREFYHDNLKSSFQFWRMIKARRAVQKGAEADIHDVLGIGERGLRKYLVYDKFVKRSFLTHILEDRTKWNMLYEGVCGNKGFLEGTYEPQIYNMPEQTDITFSRKGSIFENSARPLELEIEKKISFFEKASKMVFTQRVRNLLPDERTFACAMEFNFSIYDERFSKAPRSIVTDKLLLKDEWNGLELECGTDKCYTFYVYPVYTVNQTESGLKKTFQGITILVGMGEGSGHLANGSEMEMNFLMR